MTKSIQEIKEDLVSNGYIYANILKSFDSSVYNKNKLFSRILEFIFTLNVVTCFVLGFIAILVFASSGQTVNTLYIPFILSLLSSLVIKLYFKKLRNKTLNYIIEQNRNFDIRKEDIVLEPLSSSFGVSYKPYCDNITECCTYYLNERDAMIQRSQDKVYKLLDLNEIRLSDL